MAPRPVCRALAAFAVAAAAAWAAAVPPAAARQEFARREDKECVHCHLAEKGGGPRNESGRLYEANGFTFAKDAWSGEAAKAAYRRAVAAYRATHYAEVRRLLEGLRKTETFPGGKELLAALEEQLRPFAPAWLRAAKKNLEGTSAQRAVGLRYLLQVARECPGTPQAEEAGRILEGLRKDPRLAEGLEEAAKAEERRLRFLDARLLEETGEAAAAAKTYRAMIEEAPGTAEATQAKERLVLLDQAPAPR